jgi:hypothetical protein
MLVVFEEAEECSSVEDGAYVSFWVFMAGKEQQVL